MFVETHATLHGKIEQLKKDKEAMRHQILDLESTLTEQTAETAEVKTFLQVKNVEFDQLEAELGRLRDVEQQAEDRRKDLCKLASKYAEEGKVALRNIRRDAIDKVKKQEKEGEFSEDQSRDEQDKVQKLTDKFIAEIEKLLAEKEADILKV